MIEHGYCSITVANNDETWLIKFVSQISTRLSKGFINKFYLIFLNSKISYDAIDAEIKLMETKDLIR